MIASPLPDDFDYAAAFAAVDLDVLQSEVVDLMTTSQDWWPADWGHYGPFYPHGLAQARIVSTTVAAVQLRMLRFAPLNSWPTTQIWTRPAVWPIKKKYGRAFART